MARVALYGGGGAPFNHAAILAAAGHEVEFVFPVDILAGALAGVDAFVMPGGGYFAMQGQLSPLGVEGCRTIRHYVEAGGMYIGSCAGSYDAAAVPARFLDDCPEQAELQLVDARVWNDGASRFGVIQSPGIGELLASNVDPGHPVMAGMPAEFRITHYNGPLFVGGKALSVVAGATSNFTAAEGFLGGGGSLLIDEAVAQGVSNIVADERGEGRVVLFGSHPEFGASLTMDDAGLPATMLLNAVAWQLAARADVSPVAGAVSSAAGGGSVGGDAAGGGSVGGGSVGGGSAGGGSAGGGPAGVTLAIHSPIAAVAGDLAGLPALVDRIRALCDELAAHAGEPAWLKTDQAMSMFGHSGAEVWQNALLRIPEFAVEALAAASSLPDWVLSFRQPAEWMIDGGFWGVAPLLEQTAAMLGSVSVSWSASFPADDGYDHMTDSPYHLVAGSYLAAVGRASAAALLARAFAASSRRGEASL
ncbi:MAG: hypothetical protein JWQ64_3402 [Subtercola sp.]|nr:hypothetical protein [Subtercola sp.]